MKATDTSSFLRAESELVIDKARKDKAERTKHIGEPINLTGKALAFEVRGEHIWIAENTAVARRVDLETGNTVQLYRGHTAPVTTLAFYESPEGLILITGSWDKTIKLWNTSTKALISSTDAHDDFLKTLLVIPSLQLLVSGSSDKIVRFWDLSAITEGKPLSSAGSISAHTRPVASLAVDATPEKTILFTGDSMGIIKAWVLEKEAGTPPRWRATPVAQPQQHRTGINGMYYGHSKLWTASADETVQVQSYPAPPPGSRDPPKLTHPVAVRCLLPLALTDLGEPYLITGAGEIIRTYDLSSPTEPELLGVVDAHWHDITGLALWIRKTGGEDGRTRAEPWVVSASLDGTVRKWRLSELLQPPQPAAETALTATAAEEDDGGFKLSEEEERELAELMDN